MHKVIFRKGGDDNDDILDGTYISNKNSLILIMEGFSDLKV